MRERFSLQDISRAYRNTGICCLFDYADGRKMVFPLSYVKLSEVMFP